MDIVQQEWYQALVEECKAIITEAVFTSRWALVEGYWNLGKTISEENDNFDRSKIYGEKIVQGLGKSLNISTSTLYYAIQAYKQYPDISTLPEGKNISWNKLITKYLPEPKENKIDLPIPQGKYSTIVVDPPWPVEFMQPNQVEMPYKAMSIEEIKAFTVPAEIATDNCNLFLWTTHKYLPDALEIVKLWGFKYHVTLTWDKTNGQSLFGFHRRTEFVVYAYKGKIAVNQHGEFIDTIFTEKLLEHSRKPEIFYSILLNNTPTPRIDIFSREKREGFDQYGNESEEISQSRGGEQT